MTAIVRDAYKPWLETLRTILMSSIYGDCYHFAIAMHRGLNWQIIGLVCDGKIIHAGVKSPEEKIWDGRGEISEEEFIKPFADKETSAICEITEQMLIDSKTVNDCSVESLLKKAHVVWSELSWKQVAYEKRIIDFVNDLETLSRKYKLWISGKDLTSLPAIFEGYDDEAGYKVQPIIKERYVIRRVFKDECIKKIQTIEKNILSFVRELEELSFKHKFWLSGTTPVCFPVIFQNCGNEIGYEIRLVVGGNYLIKTAIENNN